MRQAVRCRAAQIAASAHSIVSPSPAAAPSSAVRAQFRCKGDYGFNVFHNSNPQHGGSYARHERRMRDDEVEDFMRSVKGWQLVRDVEAAKRAEELAGDPVVLQQLDSLHKSNNNSSSSNKDNNSSGSSAPAPLSALERRRLRRAGAPQSAADSATNTASGAGGEAASDADAAPEGSAVRMGEEAIQRTFRFSSFAEAYLFMGRLWAFCYGADKYPPVTWDGCEVTVYLYSPSFHGLSKREARVAAFLNDQYNMFRKSRTQQGKILQGVARTAAVDDLVGDRVRAEMAARQAAREAPLREHSPEKVVSWEELLLKKAPQEHR